MPQKTLYEIIKERIKEQRGPNGRRSAVKGIPYNIPKTMPSSN